MSRFRKIDPKIWNDDKFRSISDRAKLVFLFILTHPHMTSLGAMRANQVGMAAELGWPTKAFQEAFQEAFQKGFFEYDANASYVGVKNFLKYNPPESPNVVKNWVTQWDKIPECSLKVQLYHRVKDFLEGFGKDFPKGSTKKFVESFAIHEHENEPEHEHENEPEKEDSSKPLFAAIEPTTPPILTFPTVGRGSKFWDLTEESARALAEAFPAVDILAESKKALAWCQANLSKQKTPRGMPSFLFRWMERAQNKGNESGRFTKSPGPGQRHPADFNSGF